MHPALICLYVAFLVGAFIYQPAITIIAFSVGYLLGLLRRWLG